MLPRPSRIAVFTTTLFAVAAGSVCLGYVVGSLPRGLKVRGYGAERAHVVSFQSANLKDGYVLLAGDSHAELALPDEPTCKLKILNAGVSGAKADDYLDFLDKLDLQSRPAVAVLTLGTNHLLRKRNPAGKAAGDEYEAELRSVVKRLSTISDHVVVAAVPPAGAQLDKFLDQRGAIELTQRQKVVCEDLGCETADPYEGYRDGSFGIARPEATRDGLHLTEYSSAYRALDEVLCGL